jgi:hypothetical protein
MDSQAFIQSMYNEIDLGAFEAEDFFTEDAVYERFSSRSQVFVNAAKIQKFYSKERNLIGHHEILDVMQKGNHIYIHGVFEDKTQGTLVFADLFWLDAKQKNKITKRISIFGKKSKSKSKSLEKERSKVIVDP